jgi:hypothetical protein
MLNDDFMAPPSEMKNSFLVLENVKNSPSCAKIDSARNPVKLDLKPEAALR